MASAMFLSDHDCPVCHEEFTEPKLLPCNHRVCKKCLLSWLQAEGEGGCPLCRAPINCQSGKDKSKDTDITSLVDDLPTDLATMAIVASGKALSGSDVCGLCDINLAATSFCLDCNVKVCNTCLKPHGKIPSTRDHVVEDLGKLTSQRVIASHRTPCHLHPNKPAELYCWNHHILVCVVCAMSKHKECAGHQGVDGVDDVAQRERITLRDQTNRLRQLERDIDKLTAELEQELCDGKTYFQGTISDVGSTFVRLHKTLDKRHEEIVFMLKSQEDSFVKDRETEKQALDQQRSAVVSQVRILDQLLDNSPDSALVGMLHKLKERMDALENQPYQRTKKVKEHSKVVFDSQKLAALEKDIAGLGQLETERPPQAVMMEKKKEKQNQQAHQQFCDNHEIHQQRFYRRLPQPANLFESSSQKGDKNCSDGMDMSQRGLYPSLTNQQTRNEIAIREVKTQGEQTEQLRTVEVMGLEEDDEDMCKLYFENSRRSGGGSLDDNDGIAWDGEKQCFLITFADSEVAEKVVSRDHHLKGRNIQVKLHSPPHCYDNWVRLMGVPEGTSEDCLKNYLECVADITVTELKLDKKAGEAVVMMEPGSFDIKHLRQACKCSPLDSNSPMTFQSVPVALTNTVLVRNLKPTTTKDCICVYFQNIKRNAGGPVTSVKMLDSTTALVHFKHHEDAESVVKKGGHSLDGHPLQVALEDPQLVSSFSTPEDKWVTKNIRVLEPMEIGEPLQTDAYCRLEREEAEQDRQQQGDPFHNEKYLHNTENSVHNEMVASASSSGQTAWGTGNITNIQPVRQSVHRETPTYMKIDGDRGHARGDDTRKYPAQAEKPGNTRSERVQQPSNSYEQYLKQQGVNWYAASRNFESHQASVNKESNLQRVYQSPSATPTARRADFVELGIKGKEEIPAGRERGHQSSTVRLGTDVITKLIESQELRKKFVECLSKVAGKYQLKQPDQVIITCTQDEAPEGWISEVHKIVDRFAHVIRVELGEGMGHRHPGVSPQRSLVATAIPTEKAAADIR